jgi:sarcosine oxidase subunit beta
VVELFPRLAQVRALRQWAGICDQTPDDSPILGEVQGRKGLVLNVGWGTYGFKAAPAAGSQLAELICTGQTPELIRPFGLERFENGRLVAENVSAAVAAVGH